MLNKLDNVKMNYGIKITAEKAKVISNGTDKEGVTMRLPQAPA